MNAKDSSTSRFWPSLASENWKQSVSTLHMWTQIVGKVRLRHTPWVNHSWGVTLYVTSRGMTTSPMAHGSRVFQIDFDFIDHQLRVSTDDGDIRKIALESQTTADFYGHLLSTLRDLGLEVEIHLRPNEVETAIPFPEDSEHATYHPEAVHAFWRALASSDRVFRRFARASSAR